MSYAKTKINLGFFSESKCPHGEYDTEKAPTPVVKNPEFCVDHCHGCGNRCPVGAIPLLLLYSIGHGILAIIAGTSIGFVQKLSSSEKYGKASTVLKIIMGILILLIGFYLFYLGI